MSKQEMQGQEYQDSPLQAKGAKKAINSTALWFEKIALNLATKPARDKAPLTPARRTVLGALGVAGILSVVEIINISRGTQSVSDYLGSKVDSVKVSLGPEQTRPTFTEYQGSKDESQDFKPEGTKTGSRDNIFVTDLSDQASFTINYKNISQLMVDKKLPVPVPPNLIINIIITDQNIQDPDFGALYDQLQNNPAYQAAADEYYQSIHTPLQDRRMINLAFSLPRGIKKFYPTIQDYHNTPRDKFLAQIGFTLSFTALFEAQTAVASGRALDGNQTSAQFRDQILQTQLIQINSISDQLIQSIYQETPEAPKG